MTKGKHSFLLLVTAVLITVLAVMPRIVSAVTDLLENGQVQSASMPSIALELYEAQELDPGYMLQKLALEQTMNTIPITAGQAGLSESEVYDAVEKQMEAYFAANVFSKFDYTYQTAQPYLAMDPDDTGNFGIFWGVDYVREEAPYSSLFIHLDDTTGKILLINYYTDSVIFPPEEQRYQFEPLTQIYFHQLGFDFASEYVQSLNPQILGYQGPDNSRVVSYQFQDIEYGDITVEFYVHPNGFYIYFPN